MTAFRSGLGMGVLLGAGLVLGAAGVAWQQGWRAIPQTELDALRLAATPPPPPPMDAEARRKAAEKALEAGEAAVTEARWESAIKAGKEALELDPTLVGAHKLLGLAYWRHKEPCLGRGHFERFLELAPDDPMGSRVEKILAGDDMAACH